MSDNTAVERPSCEGCRYVEVRKYNASKYDFASRAYVDPEDEHKEYMCRRNPPILINVEAERFGRHSTAKLNDFGWPLVRAYNWCGEFSPAVKGEDNAG